MALGVVKGDCVAVSLGNTAENAALTYAVFKLGAILVPLNPTFNPQQVDRALRHLGVKALVIGAVTDLAYRPGRGRSNVDVLTHVAGGRLSGSQEIANTRIPSLRSIVVVDNRNDHPELSIPLEDFTALTRYNTVLNSPAQSPFDAALSPEEIINIQFTSGTTSAPKAAQLSHTNILNNGYLTARRMGLVPSDHVVVPPPLFHCFGSVLGFMATATTGAALLFASPAFDPLATLRMCYDHNATGLYGVPTMMLGVLDALEKEPESTPRYLKKGILAGSSIPRPLMIRLHAKLGLTEAVICYGMTETSPISCMTAPSDPLDKQVGTIGKVMPHTQMKIVSPNDRTMILPRGQKGEFASAGYHVMKGYYGDPKKTAEDRIADSDGTIWMYSGDEGEMDQDGYVSITGRIKDLIIRGGENIHPLEIEECIFQMEGIREVSVVGVPDAKLGEVVAAFVVPKEGYATGKDDTLATDAPDTSLVDELTLTRENIRQWVKTNLSSQLAPRFVFWIDEYPKTASGKIQKFKLREIALERLGGGTAKK